MTGNIGGVKCDIFLVRCVFFVILFVRGELSFVLQLFCFFVVLYTKLCTVVANCVQTHGCSGRFCFNLSKKSAVFCIFSLAKCKNFRMKYLQKLQKMYFRQDDYLERKVSCGKTVYVVSLDTMCDANKVSEFVLKPLTYLKDVSCLDDILVKLVSGVNVRKTPNFEALLQDFSNGYTLLFVDGEEGCIAVDTRTALGRSVAEPPTSMVMRGPREGFVEDIKANITLLRKRLKTNCFKTINLNVGKYTNTAVAVCYIDGIADMDIVNRIVQQLQSVNIDGVLDSSYLARYLDKERTFLFRRIGTTEKPDVAVGKMLEGRIAVVTDGSPMVLTVPYLYIEELQSPGDYYENSVVTSVDRVLRFVSVLVSVLLPSLYVCLQMYNYQIIPLKFLITILNAIDPIPFSPLSEMLLVIIIFDILREANLRMPSAVGITLSLVGAIVLGDAAVKAGLIGAPAVMIGALSGIGLFTMPDDTLILSMLRIGITLIGGLMGIMGVMLSVLLILLYMTSLGQYKTPFLAPFAPDVDNDRQDAVLQKPLQKQVRRPQSISHKNDKRR